MVDNCLLIIDASYEVLKKLGILPGTKGYMYSIEAIRSIVEVDGNIKMMDLYKKVASKYANVAYAQVERAIRYAKIRAERESTEYFECMFGPVKSITVGEFLHTIAYEVTKTLR